MIIIFDKARRMYEKLGKPVVVSDDGWDIPALSGLPGSYMKSVYSGLNRKILFD